MKRPFNFAELGKLVTGDANEVRDGEVLVIMSTENPGKIKDIQMRVNGNLVSIIEEKPAPPEPDEN